MKITGRFAATATVLAAICGLAGGCQTLPNGSFMDVYPVVSVAWSPDGKKLAAAGGPKIVVWDPKGKDLVKSFDVKEGPAPTFPTIKCLAFSPDSKTLAAGEYSLFIELKENNWTFVVSSWPAATKYDPNNKESLWGSYFYTPDKDVLRAPMKLETLPHSTEQLTWEFIDMTDTAGAMAIRWGNQMASVAFKVGS